VSRTLPNAHAPIGVFDSGLGGLTIARRLREVLPSERIIYLADQAHVPYGGRALPEVCGFACAISEALLAQGCKALVMACNISSATALPCVRSEHPDLPVLGVILPGAQAAAAQTKNRRIGILATEGTVRSGAYTRALHALDPALTVWEVSCPAFVPLVEAGAVDTPEAFAASRTYLASLQAAGVDTVVLGCTHYPFLLPTLREVAPALRFVDPAEQTIRELADQLAHSRLLAPHDPDAAPRHLLATTGDAAAFAAQIRRFLPDAAQTAELTGARWDHERLLLR
jgi:glutamate racemase